MSTVFVSYARERTEAVEALARDLAALGHEVWLDRELVGGHIWWEQILANVRRCDVFLFALSPEALDSTPCRLEYTYASDLGKAILPVLVADGVSSEFLPPALSRVHYVDYRRQDKPAAFGLVKAFAGLPSPPPLPDPLPAPPSLPSSFLGALKEQIERESLTFAEQTALVVKLRDRLGEPTYADEVRKLLGRLRQRDDLYAKVAAEIDRVLDDARWEAPSGATSDRAVEAEPGAGGPSSDAATAGPGDRQAATAMSRGRWIVRILVAVAGSFIACLGTALSVGGERYLGSAGFWEVDVWLLWPLITAVVLAAAVGAERGPEPGERRQIRRLLIAVAAGLVASLAFSLLNGRLGLGSMVVLWPVVTVATWVLVALLEWLRARGPARVSTGGGVNARRSR
jgi:TIR domain